MRALIPLCLLPSALATLPSHAPSLSVHETAFGTVTSGEMQNDIEELSIRIVSHAEAGTTYEVQCFFLKRGNHDDHYTIDDTAVFDVVNPHATYKVAAKPIRLKKPAKLSKATKSKPSCQKVAPNISPRAGYLVRILDHGNVLRECFSDHSVKNFFSEHPDLFEEALSKKSLRRLESDALIKH